MSTEILGGGSGSGPPPPAGAFIFIQNTVISAPVPTITFPVDLSTYAAIKVAAFLYSASASAVDNLLLSFGSHPGNYQWSNTQFLNGVVSNPNNFADNSFNVGVACNNNGFGNDLEMIINQNGDVQARLDASSFAGGNSAYTTLHSGQGLFLNGTSFTATLSLLSGSNFHITDYLTVWGLKKS